MFIVQNILFYIHVLFVKHSYMYIKSSNVITLSILIIYFSPTHKKLSINLIII